MTTTDKAPAGVEVPITGTTGRKTRTTADPTEMAAVISPSELPAAVANPTVPAGPAGPPPGPVPVHVALARVSAAVGAVAKSLKNEKAGYSARSIDDVLNAVHGPMTEHGVVMLPSITEVSYEVVEVGQKRTPMRQVTMTVDYTFVGPAGDTLAVRVRSEALDSGDKATNKAASAALKQALIHTFLIPIEQPDVDQDAETYERSGGRASASAAAVLPEAERAEIRAALAAAADVEAMRSGWKAAGLPAVDRLTVRHRPIVNTFLADLAASEAAPAADSAETDDTPSDPGTSTTGAVAAVSLDVCMTCGQRGGEHVDGCDEGPF